jgi:lysine 6-dehydrogenase
LPAHPKPPLNYKLPFAVRGLTNEYREPAEVLRNGEILRLPSLTEPEAIEFPPPFGMLEAFNTSGGVSTLTRTLRDRVPNIDYKTIRYPGHMAAFATMAAIGLFDETPVDGVVPRVFTSSSNARCRTTTRTWSWCAPAWTVSAAGVRRDWCSRSSIHDPKTGHSAMARTTAYPAAAVVYARLGAIERRAWFPASSPRCSTASSRRSAPGRRRRALGGSER